MLKGLEVSLCIILVFFLQVGGTIQPHRGVTLQIKHMMIQ